MRQHCEERLVFTWSIREPFSFLLKQKFRGEVTRIGASGLGNRVYNRIEAFPR